MLDDGETLCEFVEAHRTGECVDADVVLAGMQRKFEAARA